MTLTRERLQDAMSYDQRTGKFTWRKPTNLRIVRGSEAGTVDAKGYIRIKLFGRAYKAHRLAWLYVYGAWPRGQIDHANGRPDDNRIDNLREADAALNNRNKGANRNSRTGIKGVSFRPDVGKYRAQIMANRKKYYLGHFETAEEARQAYYRAAEKLHDGAALKRGIEIGEGK